MNQSATTPPEKRPIDWEAIERDYRAGIKTLEDAPHYLERRRVHLATKVLGNTDVPYTSRVKCGIEREAILLAESAVKAEIGRDMVRSMRDVV